jgi:uncharacterized protein YcaQ
MSELTLSIGAARALHLAAQGLAPARRRAGKDDVLAAIRRMRMLQIDTISVVARSPYLVLWSRLGDYDPAWLDELLAEGRLFEYWAHEACFLPIEDYGLYRHRMLDPEAMGWKYSARWMRERAGEVAQLVEHIRASGPVRAADFARQDGKSGGWWEWKPEKRSLEVLFTAGALMIARRHNFQRVYDLAERVHPSWHDDRMPALDAVRREFALRTVHALGLARSAWRARRGSRTIIARAGRTSTRRSWRTRGCWCGPGSRAGATRSTSTPSTWRWRIGRRTASWRRA